MATCPSSKPNSGEEMTSIKFDIIAHLPVEIVEIIFDYLSSEDLYSATFCWLDWKTTVTNDTFWKRLCKRDEYFEVEERNRSEFYTDLLKKHNYWQAVYWYNYTLQRNWRTNNYRQDTYVIEEPNDCLRTFVGFDVFAYHRMDSAELHVYNLKSKEFKPIIFTMRKNPKFDPRLDGPEFIQSGKYLIHFIFNQSLTVWNLDDGSTVYDQPCDFTYIHVDKNLIVLENWQDEFQVHNIETGQIEYKHKGMKKVDIMDGRILFTTADGVIHILKWTDKSEVTLKKICNQTSDCMLLVKDDLLLSFCTCFRTAETLCVWNIKTMTKLHSTILGNSYYLGANASFMNKYLYLERINNDQVSVRTLIEFWDYTKGTLVTTINRRYSNSKLSNDLFMIACNSGKMALWCFRTMDFVCDIGTSLYSVECIQDVELSQTKIVSVDKINPHQLILYVRDYEI